MAVNSSTLWCYPTSVPTSCQNLQKHKKKVLCLKLKIIKNEVKLEFESKNITRQLVKSFNNFDKLAKS